MLRNKSKRPQRTLKTNRVEHVASVVSEAKYAATPLPCESVQLSFTLQQQNIKEELIEKNNKNIDTNFGAEQQQQQQQKQQAIQQQHQQSQKTPKSLKLIIGAVIAKSRKFVVVSLILPLLAGVAKKIVLGPVSRWHRFSFG